MSKRHNALLAKAFGVSDEGFPDLPARMSNVRMARLIHGEARGCSFCFPHGHEVSNSKWMKDLRCWKRYRGTQYRERT